jgi:hypothetical protein
MHWKMQYAFPEILIIITTNYFSDHGCMLLHAKLLCDLTVSCLHAEKCFCLICHAEPCHLKSFVF